MKSETSKTERRGLRAPFLSFYLPKIIPNHDLILASKFPINAQPFFTGLKHGETSARDFGFASGISGQSAPDTHALLNCIRDAVHEVALFILDRNR